MKYTLNILYKHGKKRDPRTIQQVGLATDGDKVYTICDSLIKVGIGKAEIKFSQDGILITGIEPGDKKGLYYKQQWWLQENKHVSD